MRKGKCFSMVNRGQRRKSDFYATPYSLTRQFLEKDPFNYMETVLEPACGEGAITKVLKEYWEGSIRDSDINDGTDFLECCNVFSSIITNPPYSLAYEFIMKAKQVAANKFAMLLPLSYLHGKKRYDNIWTDKNYPLKKIYVFTRYPLLTDTVREDGKYNTGMLVYAFFVWEKRYRGYPTIDWIDNNEFVLKKGD